MTRFDARSYARYRAVYPPQLMAILKHDLARVRTTGPEDGLAIVDLGCGAGQSTVALARAGLGRPLIALDPDAAMIEEAQQRPELQEVRFLVAPGQRTGLPDACAVVVSAGSAFHWMPAREAIDEFVRLIARPGVIFIYEASFPLIPGGDPLNDWIIGKFNGDWQTPALAARGPFKNVIAPLEADPRLETQSFEMQRLRLELDFDGIFGYLRSQSRTQAMLDRLDASEHGLFLQNAREEMSRAFGPDRVREFEIRIEASSFAVR